MLLIYLIFGLVYFQFAEGTKLRIGTGENLMQVFEIWSQKYPATVVDLYHIWSAILPVCNKMQSLEVLTWIISNQIAQICILKNTDMSLTMIVWNIHQYFFKNGTVTYFTLFEQYIL